MAPYVCEVWFVFEGHDLRACSNVYGCDGQRECGCDVAVVTRSLSLALLNFDGVEQFVMIANCLVCNDFKLHLVCDDLNLH